VNPDQIAGASRIEYLIFETRHATSQFANDCIVAFPVRLLHLSKIRRTQEGDISLGVLAPQPGYLIRRDTRRSCEEIRTYAKIAPAKLEMGAPAPGHPPQIKRCTVAVPGPVTVEHRQNVCQHALFLSEDPITVFAHDGHTMKNDRLSSTDDCS
jgi:hypothetical protein